MIAPLLPEQVQQALAHGSQEELDEFNRLVEKSHMSTFLARPLDTSDQLRLQTLRDKLFPAAAQPKPAKGPGP